MNFFFDRMELTVHDLLRLRTPDDLVSQDQAPEWLGDALSQAPWVVVRRAPFEGEYVPVGVRGQNRNERFAAFIHSSSIAGRVSPENLSSRQAWKIGLGRQELPAMRALFHMHETLWGHGLRWGPVGSVGFELTTGIPVTHRTSDLDLVVRVSNFLISSEITEKLLAILQRSGVRVDLLLETEEGAISFLEFAGGESNLLLRSINGPRLIPHPGGTCRRIGEPESGKKDQTLRRGGLEQA